MSDLDTREWLLTNGLGSFASGTISDARTRTYHGWLIAALEPPSRRTLLLSHLEASLEVSGQVWALGTNFWGSGTIDPTGFKLLRSFEISPVPTWVWGEDNWQLTRQLVMPYGLTPETELNAAPAFKKAGENEREESTIQNSILIHYRYEGLEAAILRLRPIIGDRDFHHQQQADMELYFSQLVGQQQICLQAIRPGWAGTPWQLRWTCGNYQPDEVWYWDYHLPFETQRGLSDREDLYSPGYLTIEMRSQDALTLEARVGLPDFSLPPLGSTTFEQAVQVEQQRLNQLFASVSQPPTSIGNQAATLLMPVTPETTQNSVTAGSFSPAFLKAGFATGKSRPYTPQTFTRSQLLKASDQFIVYRESIAGPTAIAGYHWFNDWGRDTLIAIPGLALATKRFDLAKGLLQTFGRYCRYGLIPNAFPDAGAEPFYNSIDAALLWIETLGLYLEATQDWEFLAEQYSVVQQIYKAFTTGTLYNIQVDARDGLVSWDAPDVALTWMDALVDGQPVTPRRGKAVEINALWYSALCWARDWAQRLSGEVGAEMPLSKQARRYSQQAQQVKTSLQKFWNPQMGYLYDAIAPDDHLNAQIRPNAVLALSFHHCAFPTQQGRRVLQVAKSRLLTPYGLRSLDPADPEYIGNYAGNSRYRDRAYHQGTVWSWLIGPFIRAWMRFYDDQPVPFDWQLLVEHFHASACLGSISEIFDGDAPHAPQGAIAQAWSIAEAIRHYG